MTDQNTDPQARMDLITAALGSDKDEYYFNISAMENAAKQVLAEQGVPLKAASIDTLTSDHIELSDRAHKAMSALVSIRLLKSWERDAIAKGPEVSETFYRVAHAAISATLAATLVSPMMSDFETREMRDAARRKEGGRARGRPFAVQDEKAKAVLLSLWRDGARHTQLADWARAIIAQAPELSPPRNRGFEQFERKISKWGRAEFGGSWSVKGRSSGSITRHLQ